MRHTKARSGTLRKRAWQSMRILRRFTIPDLCRTSAVEAASTGDYENLKKWVRKLETHGYLKKIGQPVFRRLGEYQVYQLTRDTGAIHPLSCCVCKQKLTAKICQQPEKETKKKTEQEAEEQEASNDDIRPNAAAAR